MVVYSRAIGASNSIPALSTSVFTLYFSILLWILGLELTVIVGLFDLVLIAARSMFGRPKILIGRRLYAYVLRPFRSAWEGEVPALRIFRARYLTRLFLFYRAQSSMSALRRVHNRQYLELLVDDPSNSAAAEEEKKFQQVYEMYQKITTDSYQLGALALGGPIVALLSLIAQQALLPFTTWAWHALGGPSLSSITLDQIKSLAGFIYVFGAVTLWLAVSAWMDMRRILITQGVILSERQVRVAAGLRPKAEIPFDLLLYFGILILLTYVPKSHVDINPTVDIAALWTVELLTALEASTVLIVLSAIGALAATRRYWRSYGWVIAAAFRKDMDAQHGWPKAVDKTCSPKDLMMPP